MSRFIVWPQCLSTRLMCKIAERHECSIEKLRNHSHNRSPQFSFRRTLCFGCDSNTDRYLDETIKQLRMIPGYLEIFTLRSPNWFTSRCAPKGPLDPTSMKKIGGSRGERVNLLPDISSFSRPNPHQRLFLYTVKSNRPLLPCRPRVNHDLI